ncbi:hypothetical protein Ddye_022600 [Dipteronia dyeriana]|uniref:RNase H type-1 domain-containing protein n=1 Tax=Dipteronia dyeriana TaxID=168575 RepID=A0AAD9TRE6_9ROSI|nr:hypothetical protein Ddye_022600 [Dipteronia dyeriana]
MFKFRIVRWFKQFGKNVLYSISSLIINVKDLCVESKRVKKSVIKDCISPLTDSYKFNIYGSARGNPWPTSIGGVLRDSKGKMVCLFSYFVGTTNSNSAEILTIEKATEPCQLNHLLCGRVISDSKVAVSWINNKDFGSLYHVNSIYYIQSIMKEWGGMEVVHDSRWYNSFTDNLAKLGSSSNDDVLHWS